MGMSGRGGPTGPEGTAKMGTPLMSENGAMVMYIEKQRNVFPEEKFHLASKKFLKMILKSN